jgi:hypothetical protein
MDKVQNNNFTDFNIILPSWLRLSLENGKDRQQVPGNTEEYNATGRMWEGKTTTHG